MRPIGHTLFLCVRWEETFQEFLGIARVAKTAQPSAASRGDRKLAWESLSRRGAWSPAS